jgi:hypothetical protein
MLWFQLERGGDGLKHYWKMKQMQRAHLASMRKKHDTTQWRGDAGQRRGGTEEEKGGDNASWDDANLTGQKIKKIHAIDSFATNRR